MNDYVVFAALIIAVIGLAKVINIFIPQDYHQRIEDKYNQIDQ
jgi:hypothetical protein